MGVICDPFTALGLIFDGNKLSICWPSMPSIPCLAAEISAPELGKTSTLLISEEKEMYTLIVGAGSAWSSVMYS